MTKQWEPDPYRLSERMERVRPSAIMELLKQTAGGNYISFASGLPDAELFPAEALAGIAEDVLHRDGRAALQYGPAEGHPPLREWVAQRFRDQGLPASPEHILITNGSQQALDLAARLLLDDGELVVLEDPSYLAAIQIFDSLGADYDVNPFEPDRVDMAAITDRLRHRQPKVFFTLPNFQNPSGNSMPLDDRIELAETAASVGVPVLEDDAYHDLAYDGETLPSVTALAPNPMAMTTGTFSKTIAPGLRVGYLYSSPPVVERLAQLKQLSDLQSNSLAQRMVLEFCTRGLLEPQVRRLCDAYRRRRDAMLDALEEYFTGLASWTRPGGGMFLWVTLPVELDAEKLLPKAMERGIVYVPGRSFHALGGGRNTLRLNFVSAPEERIREGIRILGEVIRDW